MPTVNILPVYDISTWTDIGKRDYNEDRYGTKTLKNGQALLCYVADGHGGARCSEFIDKNFPIIVESLVLKSKAKVPKYEVILEKSITAVCEMWDIFALGEGVKIVDIASRNTFYEATDVEKMIREGKDSGSTITACIVDFSCRKLFVANLGDSRTAWAIDNCELGETMDQKPPTRSKLVMDGFGEVEVEDGRVASSLAMSASIGDHTPELSGIVQRRCKTHIVKFGEKCCNVIVASDGLYDDKKSQDMLMEKHPDAKSLCLAPGEHEDNTTVIYLKIPAITVKKKITPQRRHSRVRLTVTRKPAQNKKKTR